MSILSELKRRNVFRVAIAYALGAWILLQIVDFTMQVITAPDWILQTFTMVAALGLPVVIIIAWVFEKTPEGIKLESKIAPEDSVTSHTSEKLTHLIVVFLALAVVFLLADKFFLGERSAPTGVQQSAEQTGPEPGTTSAETQETEEQSIAVLPFVNMSANPDQEFFSDGISEEILNVLTHIPNLKVAARTSSFQFKGQNLDIADIGQQLQVAHVLEGSVRTANDRVRITAQLVQVSDGFHLWSRTFDRELVDVFAIQDEIANAIANELRATFTTDTAAVAVPVDIKAYQLFLKGRGLLATRGEDNILQGIEDLQAALAIEPNYAPALANLSVAYAVLPWYSVTIPSGVARETARKWAEKALEIDPNNVEALSVLGLVRFQVDLDWQGAREMFVRALEIGPANVTANNFYGDYLIRIGDKEQTLVYESRAAELDPLGGVQWMDMANAYEANDQPDQVLIYAQRAIELNPHLGNAVATKMRAHYYLGQVDEMEALLERALPTGALGERIDGSLSNWIRVAKGEREQALEVLHQRVALARKGELSFSRVASDAAILEEFDIAGEMLMQAVATGDGVWQFPVMIRLPEQAPDSEIWQEFWRTPGVAELAEIRRSHGLKPDIHAYGSMKHLVE